VAVHGPDSALNQPLHTAWSHTVAFLPCALVLRKAHKAAIELIQPINATRQILCKILVDTRELDIANVL
jgi:hypothetical protein